MNRLNQTVAAAPTRRVAADLPSAQVMLPRNSTVNPPMPSSTARAALSEENPSG